MPPRRRSPGDGCGQDLAPLGFAVQLQQHVGDCGREIGRGYPDVHLRHLREVRVAGDDACILRTLEVEFRGLLGRQMASQRLARNQALVCILIGSFYLM